MPIGVLYPAREDAAGCEAAPTAIRERSQRFARFTGHHDFDVGGPLVVDGRPRIVDCGDVDGPATATRTVHSLLERGTVPIVLGGDDSVPIHVLRAYRQAAALTVVQVDAHLDFRDEVEGVREGYSSAMRRASEMAWVERIVQVGLRGVGSARAGDVADAVGHGNALVTARELDELGPEAALDHIPDGARIFLSLDCDGLDPTVLPAVRAPMPGGLSYRQAAELVRRLADRGPIAGMALTELVPSLDASGLSTLVAVRLIVQLIGAMRRSGQIG